MSWCPPPRGEIPVRTRSTCGQGRTCGRPAESALLLPSAAHRRVATDEVPRPAEIQITNSPLAIPKRLQHFIKRIYRDSLLGFFEPALRNRKLATTKTFCGILPTIHYRCGTTTRPRTQRFVSLAASCSRVLPAPRGWSTRRGGFAACSTCMAALVASSSGQALGRVLDGHVVPIMGVGRALALRRNEKFRVF